MSIQPSLEKFRIELGGDWDITDLENLVESIRISYSYFYWISVPPDHIEAATRTLIIRHFWSQKWQLSKTAEELYRRMPTEYRMKLVSIHYASPGWIELAGYIGAISLMAGCASRWVKALGEGFDLFTKIQKYFDDRKLSPPPDRLDLDNFSPKDIEEARHLCFELGGKLDLTKERVESMIELTGNPISTLRLMVNLSNEARRIVRLEEAGKLKLPK